MTIKDQVLKACISVATNQNHGHMTAKIVFNHLVNLGITDYTRGQVSKCISGHPNWWRQGLPRNYLKANCLIRELKAELWQEKSNPEDEIKDLRSELQELIKQRDANQSRINSYIINVEQLSKELKSIRATWRNFQNLMLERR